MQGSVLLTKGILQKMDDRRMVSWETLKGGVWEEGKWAKTVCSGSLALCFVNNDYVTAEIIYRPAHAVTRFSLGHGLRLIYELHPKKWWHSCCIMTVSIGSACRGEHTVCLLLQLLGKPGERLCCVRLRYGCCTIRREWSVPFLWLLQSSSSLLARALPTLGSVRSVNSETVCIMNRMISDTLAFPTMHSAYKLNKGDNIQPWCIPFPIMNQSVVPCPVLTVASWPACRFLRRQVRWSDIPSL